MNTPPTSPPSPYVLVIAGLTPRQQRRLERRDPAQAPEELREAVHQQGLHGRDRREFAGEVLAQRLELGWVLAAKTIWRAVRP